jgi:hypothetical protein
MIAGRWIEEGQYDVTVRGVPRRVEATSGITAFRPTHQMASRVVPSSRVSTFQSGHGFTQGTGTGTNSDDTVDFTLGAQSRKYVSAGTAGFCRDTKTGLTIDLTGKFARVLLKFDKVLATEVTGAQLYFSTDNTFTNFYKVELFDLLSGPTRNTYWLPNEWAYVTMGLSEFTTTGAPTLGGITVARSRLPGREHGRYAPTRKAIDLMPAPSVGVVSIMFDDGWASHYTKAQPLHEPGTASRPRST